MASAEAIGTLVAIIDRTVAFLRTRRKQKTSSFEEDVQPLFDAMLEIHSDYRAAFVEILDTWDDIGSREELAELIRKKKWRLQPLRDVTHALLDELQARNLTKGDFADFYGACWSYFGVKGTIFVALIDYVLWEDPLHASRNVRPSKVMLEYAMECCEGNWARIAHEFAQAKASR